MNDLNVGSPESRGLNEPQEVIVTPEREGLLRGDDSANVQ